MEFIWWGYFFLKFFNKPLQRESDSGGQKYFFRKFHSPRESDGVSLKLTSPCVSMPRGLSIVPNFQSLDLSTSSSYHLIQV